MMPDSSEKSRQRTRLVVTGASGNLGYWICRLGSVDWSVSGVHFRHPFAMAGVTAIQADLTRPSEVDKLFAAIRPQAVIHAAAIAQPTVCEDRPHASSPINVDLPEYLAGRCADRNIPFVFTSTDLVFDGLKAPYGESDPVSPICAYGHQKARAEEAVLKRFDGALVCRLPLMIGVGPRETSSFSMQMLSGIRQGRPLKLFIDEYRTPVDYQSAARGLLELVGKAQGRLHLGGKSRVSRFELGMLMAQQMDVPPTMLQPVTLSDFALRVARSPDCSLRSDAADALGYHPTSLLAAVKQAVDQFEFISKS